MLSGGTERQISANSCGTDPHSSSARTRSNSQRCLSKTSKDLNGWQWKRPTWRLGTVEASPRTHA